MKHGVSCVSFLSAVLFSSCLLAQTSPIYINGSNVGIGTPSPLMKLDIFGGGIHIGYDPSDNNLGKIAFHHSHVNSKDRYFGGILYNNSDGVTSILGARYDIHYWAAPGFGILYQGATWDDTQKKYLLRPDMYLDGSRGYLGLGTDSPRARLDVNGSVMVAGTVTANRFSGDGSGLIITPSQSGQWADYVFEAAYSLRPLEDVEAFYSTHKHLPDVPSEKEVSEKGIALNAMQATLLRKIEELTLYVVQQNKRIKALEAALKRQSH